jgi:hypothetical protein
MQSVSVLGLVVGALVLMGLAWAVSRRSLAIGAILCVLALALLGYAYAEWAHLL